MYADVNRKSLDPEETHFSQMLFHQGRAMLPSDLNESGAIFQYYLRQFIMDFVGKRWRTTDSFEISDVDLGKKNFKLSKGHFYVDGILCVNEVDCWYSPEDKETVQPMFPTPEWDEIKNKNLPKDFAVYLECWERHVNSSQRPAIREVALGGPDTSSRLEIAWQVRVLTPMLAIEFNPTLKSGEKLTKFTKAISGQPQNGLEPCKATQELLDDLDAADPKLRVWAKKPADATDPCSISPDAQYRGLENQLYRVEIHRPGVVSIVKVLTQPSFKWSRENGSVVFRIVPETFISGSTEHTLDLEVLGRDHRYGLCVNDWVELISDEIEFGQKVLPLAKVKNIDPTLGRVTFTTKTEADFSGCTLLRRWDQKDESITDTGTIDITEASDDKYEEKGWITLERGIKIQFQPGGNYRKGDYWLVQALVATGDVEWPNDKGIPKPRPTDGIKRHRAALAVVINGKMKPSNCGCIPKPICQEE